MDKNVAAMALFLLFLFGLTFAAHMVYVVHEPSPAAAHGAESSEQPQSH